MRRYTTTFLSVAGALAASLMLGACGGGEVPDDLAPPTVSISCAAGTAGTVVFTFQFNEPVQNFAQGDVQVEGGTVGAFTVVSPTAATLSVTPTAGTTTVTVEPGRFSDLAGNTNESSAIQTYPATANAPTITSMTAQGNAERNQVRFVLTFDRPIRETFTATSMTVNGASIQDGHFDTSAMPGTTRFILNVRPLSSTSTITLHVPAGAFQDTSATPTFNQYDHYYTANATDFAFASLYLGRWPQENGSPTADGYKVIQSTEGGNVGIYIGPNSSGDAVDAPLWWGGSLIKNVYWGWGIDSTNPPTHFGGYVNAPNNGLAVVSHYNSVVIGLSANSELLFTSPTVHVVLVGPTTGTGLSACTPKLTAPMRIFAQVPNQWSFQDYEIPLGDFVFQTACSYTTTAAALATGVQSVHVQLKSDNMQFVTQGVGSTLYPNGLEIRQITFR